jgi:hypothetical protein
MLENLIYILSSTLGGPIAFTLTALVRGIGSIPGHAFWTGLTGTGLGWFLMKRKARDRQNMQILGNISEPSEDQQLEWKLLDPKSGEFVGSDTSEQAVVAPATELLGEFRLPLLEPYTVGHHQARIPIPKHPLIGLALAISGHAFWNGTLTAIELIGIAANMSDGEIFALSLLWSGLLVCGVLLLGREIIRSVIASPDSV